MHLYVLLVLSILFAVMNNLILHKFGNRGHFERSGILMFNGAVSSVWILIFSLAAIPGGGIHLDRASILWGILYGSITAFFLLFKMQAMTEGPVSLTSFIGCSSLLISTGFGIFVLHERITVLQGIGVLLLMVSLFLVVAPGNEQARKTWKFWCSGFLFCSAAVGIIFKLHQRSLSAPKISEMMFVAALTSSLLFFLAAVVCNGKKGICPLPKSVIPYVLICGVISCVYNRLNILLAGKLPSVVFYPTFNGSVILLSTLSGIVLFREKLKKSQILGLFIGAASLMLASGSTDFILFMNQ